MEVFTCSRDWQPGSPPPSALRSGRDYAQLVFALLQHTEIMPEWVGGWFGSRCVVVMVGCGAGEGGATRELAAVKILQEIWPRERLPPAISVRFAPSSELADLIDEELRQRAR